MDILAIKYTFFSVATIIFNKEFLSSIKLLWGTCYDPHRHKSYYFAICVFEWQALRSANIVYLRESSV